jgi:hypothetical protein
MHPLGAATCPPYYTSIARSSAASEAATTAAPSRLYPPDSNIAIGTRCAAAKRHTAASRAVTPCALTANLPRGSPRSISLPALYSSRSGCGNAAAAASSPAESLARYSSSPVPGGSSTCACGWGGRCCVAVLFCRGVWVAAASQRAATHVLLNYRKENNQRNAKKAVNSPSLCRQLHELASSTCATAWALISYTGNCTKSYAAERESRS